MFYKVKKSSTKEILIPQEVIEKRIYWIRGQKIMLDRDLAYLYEVETRVLNQAVRRNINRFPKDFMFILTRKEIMRISQTVISLKFSKNVFVFTEQGVAMLSSVLNSEKAVLVNIAIMRTFVRLRKIISAHKFLADKLNKLEFRMDKNEAMVASVFEAIKELMAPPPQKERKIIGFHP